MKHSLYAYLSRQSSEVLENLKVLYENSQECEVDGEILRMLEEILQKRKKESANK